MSDHVGSRSSVLPLLMYPQHYVRKLNASLHLAYIAKLIKRLPVLEANPQWPTWWYFSLPLSCLRSYNADAPTSITLQQIHYRYLLGGFLTAIPAINDFYYLNKVSTFILNQVFYALCPLLGRPGLLIPDPIRSYTAFTHQELQTIYDCHDENRRRSTSFSH